MLGVRDARAALRSIVEQVVEGGPVAIMDRSQPVAVHLEDITRQLRDFDGALGRWMFPPEFNLDLESTLAAAGFQARPADSPAKMEKLKLLPQRKLRSKTKDGELIYFYADAEFCQCLYVGDQAAYSRYQQLAIQQKIAQEQMNAAEMNEDAAMDWGMWGPFW